MRYEEIPVEPALRHLVVNFWLFAADERDPPRFEHTIVPDGTSAIGFSRPSRFADGVAVFVGPRVTAAKVEVVAGGRYCGIRFQPGAGGSALRLRIDSLRDSHGLLSMVSPDAAVVVVDAMRGADGDGDELDALHRIASSLARDAEPVDAIVAKAVEAIVESDGLARVADVAVGIGVGERTLQRRFRAAVGLTPKEFARMRRIRRACLLALQDRESGLAGVSSDAGFADQAHLTREFGGVFGWSPRLTLAYLERIEHGNIT